MTSKSTDGHAGERASRPARSPAGGPQALGSLLDQLARIEGATPTDLAWEDGAWKVDFWRQSVNHRSGSVRLNLAELIIFGRLLAAAGAVVEKDELHAHLARLWTAGDTSTVASRLGLNISRMRAKFTQAGIGFPIQSVRGLGYRLTSSAND